MGHAVLRNSLHRPLAPEKKQAHTSLTPFPRAKKGIIKRISVVSMHLRMCLQTARGEPPECPLKTAKSLCLFGQTLQPPSQTQARLHQRCWLKKAWSLTLQAGQCGISSAAVQGDIERVSGEEKVKFTGKERRQEGVTVSRGKRQETLSQENEISSIAPPHFR